MEMKKKNKKNKGIICSWALGCLVGIMPLSANAQRVVFPQAKQAGTATLKTSENKFVLGNNLLQVSYSLMMACCVLTDARRWTCSRQTFFSVCALPTVQSLPRQT